MAFQKTQGRKKFIQPAGSPDFSGFKRAASLYDQVGKDVYDIGTRNRNAQLADLVLQAEAEGITAASTYDNEGNIVPLRNFEVSDMIKSQGYGESDKRAIEQSYRKAAISTYQTSVALQAKAVAEQSLLQNPDKPEQIMASMKGFIDGLELPSDVAPYIIPSITSEFVEKKSQATAERLRKSNIKTKDMNLAAINNSTVKISKLMAGMAGLPPEERNNAELMISELQKGISGNYEALKTVGYTDAQITELGQQSSQIIQTRMAISHVERKFLSTNDYAESKREVESLYLEVRDDPNIDADALRTAMKTRLEQLKSIRDAETTARDKMRASTYGDALLNIALGGTMSAEEINALDISSNQKYSVLSVMDGAISTRRNNQTRIRDEIKKVNTEQYDELMLQIVDPNLPERIKQEAIFNIQKMRSDPPSGIPITTSQYSAFIKELSAQQVSKIKSAGDLFLADLEISMSEKRLTVKDLKDLTPFLMEKGYIGDTKKGAQMDVRSWSKVITGYMSDLNRDAKESKELQSSHRKVVQGTASKSDHERVANTTDFEEIVGADSLSFGSADPTVRDENSFRATKYALAYKTLPPQAVDFLKAINTSAWSDDEGMYDAGRVLFDRILYSLTTGITKDGQSDIRIGEIAAIKIMEDSGVDTSQYIRARRTTHKDFFAQRASINSGRVLRGVEEKLGMPLMDKIQMNFSEALDTNRMGVIAQFIPGLAYEEDKRIEHTMDMLENQIGFGVDLSDVQLDDPLFLLHINARVRQLIATGKIDLDDEDSFNHGLKLAASQISDSIGINVDSSGRAYWAMSPWVKDAEAEIGDSPLPLKSAFRGEMSAADAVFFDIRTRLKGMSTLSPKIVGLLNDEDSVIKLVQEPLMGEEQTYTVQVQDPDTGENYNVQAGYRFRWETSALNPIMKAAEARVTNSGFKQFFNRFNFINKSFLQSEASKIVRDMNDDVSILAVEGTGRNEFMRNASNVLKKVYNVAFPYEDFDIPPKYDEADVEIINALFSSLANNGGMSFEDFLEEIEGLYE